MGNLLRELEISLNMLADQKAAEGHYSSKEAATKWLTQDFAEWLVKKFVEERYK